MSKIVHRIDAPLIPGAVMGSMGNAVDDWVPHVDIRGSHVNPGPEHLFTIAELTVLHAGEQIHVFLNAAVPVRAFLASLCKGAAHGTDFLRRAVIHIGLASLDKLNRKIIQLPKIIRCVKHPVIPAEAQPLYIRLNGVNVLHVLLHRVSVIKAQVALAPILLGQPEVQADGLGMSHMQVAVRLRWKTSMDPLPIAAVLQIVIYFILDKIRSSIQNFRHKICLLN